MAAEQLTEYHGLTLSAETLRGWLRAEGVTHCRRRKRPHRAWRARQAHVGEWLQLDGSHHDWLEGQGPRGVLMASIDDASRRVFARFSAYEGPMPAMDSVQRDIRQQGIPLAVYADTHTPYTSPAQPTVDDQLAGGGAAESVGAKPLRVGGRSDSCALPPRPRAGSSGCVVPSRIG